MNRLFQGNGFVYACGHKRQGNQYLCPTCFPKGRYLTAQELQDQIGQE